MQNKYSVQIAIMAGGQGIRFWPASRKVKPKQFLAVGDISESLLVRCARRLIPISDLPVMVVTSDRYVDQVREEFRSEEISDLRVIAEPCARNTAAANGLAAALCDPTTVIVSVPADHTFANSQALIQAMSQAIELAVTSDTLVSLGATPTSAHTGYGYIERGAAFESDCYRVKQFVEKPDFQTAQRYLDGGSHFWNMGIFIWRAGFFMDQLSKYLPEAALALSAVDMNTSDEHLESVLADIYHKMPSISVDYGIMEHSDCVSVVEVKDCGWNDVGSWESWAQELEPDERANALKGDCIAVDSSNCIAFSSNSNISLLGCKDLVVIESEGAILVCPRSKVQQVREIVDQLKKQGRTDLL